MKRTLLSTLVITSTLGLSANVFALGMGELELKSTLNQPLQAEITLNNIDDLSEWEIKPSLASDGDFDRAGVEKIFFLSDIDFEIQGNRIVLTSEKSVTEPFLNFLVQVNWPSGRVLREYTLLLDPPVFDEQIQPLAMQQASQRVETQAVVPVAAASAPAENQWQSQAAAPGTYKVQKDDTLWEIAINTRPNRQVTPQQMMLAIQDGNPGAFIKGNINRLKTHQVLRIPTEQQMAARDNNQAINEVLRQNLELKTAGAQLDATAKAAESNKSEQLTDGGELKLLSKESEVSESAGASGEVGLEGKGTQDGLQNDLAIALETLDTSKLENDDLKTRLAALEEQIATLQKLVSLKDDQLAGIQTLDLQKSAQQNEVDENSIEAESDQLLTESPESLGVEDAVSSEETMEAETDTDFNYSESTEQETAEVPEDALATQPEVADTASIIDPALAADQIQQQIEDRYKPKGLVAEVMAKPELLAGLVGGIALLLGLIGMAWKKRRQNKEEQIEDPDLVGFDENFEFTDDGDDASLDSFEFDEDDTTLVADDELNDDLLEGIGSQGDDEAEASAETTAQTADVIGEAEIYIAYGRFDQAADLLKNSIQQEPSRLDFRMKLLEVYVETDDAVSFAEAELDLNSIGDVESNDKAVAMRARLSSPINGDEDDISADNTDFIDELSPEMDIEGLADAGDEFADGIDFAAALDFSEEDDFASEGEDFATSLEAVDELSTETDLELDSDLDMDFDLSEPELDELPTLEEIPELEEVPELEELAVLEEIPELEEVPELEELAVLEEVPELEGISELKELSNVDELPTLDELDDFSDLEELSDIETLSETNEESALDDLSFDENDLDLGEDLSEVDDNSVVELAHASDSNDDLSELESLLDGDEVAGSDAGLPDLSFDLEDTGFANDDLGDDLQSLEAELDVLAPAEESVVEVASEEVDAEEVVAEEVETQGMMSEFDLDELEDLPDFTAETAAADVESGADQEIDLDQLAASDNEFDFLAGTDECSTKLDLARAYFDMEDLDGAKELLQEVISEGNDQQRSDARSLLDSIG